MLVRGQAYRTIFVADDGWSVAVIDQTRLPFAFELLRLQTAEQAAQAICNMVVRGAPLIGVTAAYGVALGLRADATDVGLKRALAVLTSEPARVLGRSPAALQTGMGRLYEGGAADVCVFDPEAEWVVAPTSLRRYTRPPPLTTRSA